MKLKAPDDDAATALWVAITILSTSPPLRDFI